MKVVDIHKRIKQMAKDRGLSTYELAKRSGMTISSLYNMFERGTMPKIETLQKICDGMEVSLSDFFAFCSKPKAGSHLTENDILLLEINRELTKQNQEKLMIYAEGMKASQSGN